MFKSVIAASAALPLFAGAAVAGPYVNLEANAAYPDGEYSGATTDLHVGYEGAAGRGRAHCQRRLRKKTIPQGYYLIGALKEKCRQQAYVQ